MSQGIRRRIAAAGVSAVMAGGLLFGMTGTAEATPAATAAPTTVSAPVALVAVTTAAPTTSIVASDKWDWKHKRRCHRVWHRASWYWWHHHRSFKRGWWSCRYW